MKKSVAVIISLLVIVIILAGILVYGIFKGREMSARIYQLEQDREQISKDKEDVMAQLEDCRTLSETDHEKLNMILQDWSKIQKTCFLDNVCKGKFPFMRYKCNAQGDAVDNGDKVCECDQNCNLKVS